MKYPHSRAGRPAWLTALSMLLLMLLVVSHMAVGVCADTVAQSDELYNLQVRFYLYDENGDEVGMTGVKAELAAGTPIDVAALISRYPDVAALLADYTLIGDYMGMPADGLMPAADLSLEADFYDMAPVTVTWVVEGTSTEVSVPYGELPVYPGSEPTKAADAQYEYTFKGWDVTPAPATEAVTYTAQFEATVRTYTVTFVYGDGQSTSVEVAYGAAAVAPTDTDKSPDDTHTYVFRAWDTAFDCITGPMTVTALYNAVPIEVNTGSSETDTNEPDSDTSEPESNTDEPASDTVEPESDTSEPTSESDTPLESLPGTATTETESEPPAGGCGDSWWWILILLAVILVALVVVLLLRRKASPPPAAPSEPDAQDPVTTTPTDDTSAARASTAVAASDGEEADEPLEPLETVDIITADAVDTLMTDKTAQRLLEISGEPGGVGKLGIINIGIISAAYQAGDTVDLAGLQAKGMIEDTVGRLKVLASGTLDKPLTIKAEAFSMQAIKMIALTGGHAVKLGFDKE